jgi:hypothetical protein
MAFDINLPRTPSDGSFLSWGLWAVRAPSTVALSLVADTAAVVAGVARAAAGVIAGSDAPETSSSPPRSRPSAAS